VAFVVLDAVPALRKNPHDFGPQRSTKFRSIVTKLSLLRRPDAAATPPSQAAPGRLLFFLHPPMRSHRRVFYCPPQASIFLPSPMRKNLIGVATVIGVLSVLTSAVTDLIAKIAGLIDALIGLIPKVLTLGELLARFF
jgi:hypothetical protein